MKLNTAMIRCYLRSRLIRLSAVVSSIGSILVYLDPTSAAALTGFIVFLVEKIGLSPSRAAGLVLVLVGLYNARLRATTTKPLSER